MTTTPRIQATVRTSENKTQGCIPGFPCQAKNCDSDASSMVELHIGPHLTWYLWSCGDHAGSLEDLLGGLSE
jgi:hypothetical protein